MPRSVFTKSSSIKLYKEDKRLLFNSDPWPPAEQKLEMPCDIYNHRRDERDATGDVIILIIWRMSFARKTDVWRYFKETDSLVRNYVFTIVEYFERCLPTKL